MRVSSYQQKTDADQANATKGPQDLAQGFNLVSTLGTADPQRRALKGRQIERANNVEHRSTCEQNTGWKPMLHWPSGLSSDLPEPSRELSPCDTPSLHHSVTPLLHHLRPHSRAMSCTHSSSTFRY
jgi:hypothetical protein